MSANLLNSAAMPGAAPGASVGIAAQAAQAAQAQGPLAGFEAMLAAFFGDQGLIAPGIGGAVAGGPAVAGQAIAGAPGATTLTGKAAGKTAGGADKGSGVAVDADKTADPGATVLDATANGVDAALALIVPLTPNPVQPNPTAPVATDAAASGATPDAGLGGKAVGAAALAQLTAALTATDAKTAKAAGVLAQDTTATPATTAAPQAVSASAPANPGPEQALPAPALNDPAVAAAFNALQNPPAATAAVAFAQAKTAEPTGGAKVPTAKGERVEGARTEVGPVETTSKSAIAVPAFADGAGKDAASSERNPTGPATPDAKPAAADTTQGGDFNLATNSTAANSAAALAHAAGLVRGTPQTVANLAAQIAKKLDGRSSRFDVQLDPAGLGKVDVRVEIDAAGKMTAAMNFDNQQAANELKSRAGELQRALEQAGFDMSGGLSFDVAGQGGQGRSQGQDADSAPVFRGRAFQAVLDGGADAAALTQSSFSRASASGVDIRI